MFYRTSIFAALFSILMIPSPPSALETGKDAAMQTPFDRREVPDDAYIPVSREDLQTSSPYRYSRQGFFTVQVNVDHNGNNIVGDAANEPSIAVDPTDPGRMAIGWRQFNTISSSFRQAGYGYTTDGGRTWTFPGVIEPGVFRSDPVLGSDSDGNFYFNSLTSTGSDMWCNVFKSSDGGATWDSGTFAQGGDKQWMAIDKTGGMGDGHIYAYWTQDWSICYPGYFTRSVDSGASYEDCITIPGYPFWGTLAVGPDGELYLSGNEFVVIKSTNAQNSGETVSWDFSRSVSLDGGLAWGGPNPDGLLGQSWIAVDHSNGPTRGNVYLLCSVDRYSVSDPLDVMFARSTDGGQTWSAPVRVNDDPGENAYQWFGTMSVAPTGRIDVVWLDTRHDTGGYDSSLYYAYSEDEGVSWSANERLTDAFDPHVGWPQQNKMGDYIHMVSDESGFHLAYAATFNGEQDVYYGRLTHGIPRLVSGPGPGVANPPLVRLFQPEPDAAPDSEFSAYGAQQYGVNVTCGNMDGDGMADILTGPGPGAIYGPHVRGFRGDGTQLAGLNFLAYGTKKYGVNVAGGDLDNDGMDEIITGAGPGAVFGPHVRAFDYDGTSPVVPVPGVSYFSYGTPKWGVNVTAGDIDGDGYAEIVTGAGPGAVYGPHVRGWNVDGETVAAIPAVSYLAYGSRKFGVNVGCGDVDGDGAHEIMTAPGPSVFFSAHIRGWNYDGLSVSPLPGLSFLAWDNASARYGARVSSGADLDENGRDELVVGPGPDPAFGTPVKVFHYTGSEAMEWLSLQAYPGGWTHGANAAAGWF